MKAAPAKKRHMCCRHARSQHRVHGQIILWQTAEANPPLSYLVTEGMRILHSRDTIDASDIRHHTTMTTRLMLPGR